MPRGPDDEGPGPPGGRAAERLREFIEQRFPGGIPEQAGAREPDDAAPDDVDAVERAEEGGGPATGGSTEKAARKRRRRSDTRPPTE